MAYNLSMQMNLQAPSAGEISSVKKTIESGLSGIKVSALDAASFSKANNQINETRQHLEKGQKAANSFLTELEGKGRSFVAYTVASTAVLKLVASIRNATMGAIEYDAELIRIAQTTGDTVDAIYKQSSALIDISKNYNISATKVAQFTKVLAQTGLGFRDAARGAEILAKTTLLASFDNISETTEGLISLMNTFKLSVSQAGGVLEEINAVSKKYAVESSDIVDAIRRSGGAFKSAGGNITELIGLFTSVRATSRESAETIATAFNTIFGRLQRPETIEYFKQLGIELATIEGNFVGPNEAIKRIGEGLARLGINAGSVQFAAIAEKIGGLRQLSKVIPLLNQYSLAQDAMRTANTAGVSSLEDMEKAQKGIGYQLGTLQKDFQALIQEVVSSDSFKFAVDVFINMSKALLEITRALKPLLPLLAAFVTFKIGRGLTSFLSGSGGPNLKGIKGAASAIGMASGGVVPGTGNRDTVPAMLTPGEFVIRKSSVNKIGMGSLNAMNANHYENGGGVEDIIKKVQEKTGNAISVTMAQKLAKEDRLDVYLKKHKTQAATDKAKQKKLTSSNIQDFGAIFVEKQAQPKPLYTTVANGQDVDFRLHSAFLSDAAAEHLKSPIISDKVSDIINDVSNIIGGPLLGKKISGNIGVPNLHAIIGSVFEGALGKLEGVKQLGVDEQRTFDFPNGLKQLTEKMFGSEASSLANIPTDAKFSSSSSALRSIRGKAANYLSKGKAFAKGGASTDTVPALLTPGEFVINKKSAASIGHSNLNRMNKQGVVGFAKGGIVGGIQRLAAGGSVEDDIKRGTGAVVTSFKQLKNEVDNVIQDLGNAGLKLIENLNVTSRAPSGKRGVFEGSSLKQRIGVNLNKGTESTVAHEIGHAVDFQAGGNKGFASEQQGTLQNELAKAAQGTIKAALQAKGVSEKDLAYRTDLREIFADLFEKSEPEVRAILANTTDAAKGMEEIGKLMASQPAKFSRLYGDVHKNVKIQEAATATTAKQAVETAKVSTSAVASAKKPASKFKAPSLLEGIFATQSAASALKTFGGVNVNQEALGKAEGRAGVFGAAGDFAGKFARKGAVGAAGKAIGNVPGLSGVGQLIYKNAGLIAKGAGILAKGLNVAGWVDLFGGFADSLITPDFGKVKDAAIARGDADSAAAAAAREYAQSQLQSIPIIGGALSALRSLGEYFGAIGPASEKDLDARGKLIVGNARLSASLNGLDKKLQAANQSLDQALLVGDNEASQKAFAQGGAAIADIQSQINAQNATAADTAGGKVGTAFADAGKSALAGAAAGALIAGPIGAAVGAIGAGAYAFYSSFTSSTESVVKAHELNAEAYAKMGEAVSQRISQVGGLLTNETSRVIASGGSIEQAFDNIRNKLGGKEFDKLFGNIDPKNLGAELKKLNVESETSAKAVEKTSKALGQAEIQGDKTAISIAKEASAKAQADQLKIETTKKEVAGILASQIQQEALNKERAIEAKAISEQIKAMRDWTKHMDKVNDKFRELEDIADDMSKVGTGEQTFDQARGTLGIGISRNTLQKSTDEIFRDDKAFGEIRGSIAGSAGGRLDDAKKGFGAIEKVESVLSDVSSKGAKDIAKLVHEGKGATEDKRTTLKTDIASKLVELTGLGAGGKTGIAALDAALLEYADSLVSSGGLQNIAGASEDAKKKLTSQVEQFVEAHKETINKLIQAQQQYRQGQLQLIQKQIDFANKVYETEKSYAEETISLREKTALVLSKGKDQGRSRKTEFAIRAGALAASDKAAAARRAGLGKNLQQSGVSGAKNLGLTGKIPSDVNALVTSLQALKGTSDQTSVALQGAANSYITAIRDQIDQENKRLDLIIEQAEAQRDYTQALRDAQGDLVSEFGSGTDEQREEILNTATTAQFAAQQGSLAGVKEEDRSKVTSFLRRFSDVALPGGGGKTGGRIAAELEAKELANALRARGQRVSQSQEKSFADAAEKKQIPISQQFAEGIKSQTEKIQRLVDYEKMLKDQLNNKEAENIASFGKEVVKFGLKVQEINAELNKKKAGGVEDVADKEKTFKSKKDAAKTAERNASIAVDDAEAELTEANESVAQQEEKLRRKYGGVEAPPLVKFTDGSTRPSREMSEAEAFERKMLVVATERQKKATANLAKTKEDSQATVDAARAEEYYAQQEFAASKLEANKKATTQTPAAATAVQAQTAAVGEIPDIPLASGPLFFEDPASIATQVQAQKDAAAAAAQKKADSDRRLQEMLQKNRENRESLGFLPGSSLGGQSFQASQAEQLDAAKRLAREAVNPKPIGKLAADPFGASQTPKVELIGSQEVTVRLPDIQALVNQQITALVFSTVAEKFTAMSEDIRNANNFGEVADAFKNGVEQTTTENIA